MKKLFEPVTLKDLSYYKGKKWAILLLWLDKSKNIDIMTVI